MRSPTRKAIVFNRFAVAVAVAAMAVGTAALAAAEDTLDERGYADCLVDGLDDPDARGDLTIEACCIGNGGEVVYDSGSAIDCVPPITIEEGNQPPPPSKAPTPPRATQPGLAPPPTPTTTPRIAPAPAPGLAPR